MSGDSDNDDDYVLSDDDDEEMSPDSLKKEEVTPVKKADPEASSSMDQSASFDMDDFETDDSAPTSGSGTSIVAPPGSIENIINQVHSKSQNNMSSIPSGSVKRGELMVKQSSSTEEIRKQPSSESKVKKQSTSDSALKRLPSSEKVIKKQSSTGNVIKKQPSNENALKKPQQSESVLKKQNSNATPKLVNKSSSKKLIKKESSRELKKAESVNRDKILEKKLSYSKSQEVKLESTTSSFADSPSDNYDDEYNNFENESVASTERVDPSVNFIVQPSAKKDSGPCSTKPIEDSFDESTSSNSFTRNESLKKQSSSDSSTTRENIEPEIKNEKSSVNVDLSGEFVDKKTSDLSDNTHKSAKGESCNSSSNCNEVSTSGAKVDLSSTCETDDYADDVNDFEVEDCGDEKNIHDEDTSKVKTQDIANSVVDTPQKSNPKHKGAPEARSPNRRVKVTKEEEEYQHKIVELDKKIREIAAEREKYSPLKKSKRKKFPKVKVDKPKPRAGKKYTHSKLKYIMADVSISPYMTAPNAKYSQETLRLPEIIRNAKFDESLKNLPFDEKVMEEKFIKEVYNYKKPDVYH